MDVTKATPLDTVELDVTFPEDEIVTTTPKPAEAGPTENVEPDCKLFCVRCSGWQSCKQHHN